MSQYESNTASGALSDRSNSDSCISFEGSNLTVSRSIISVDTFSTDLQELLIQELVAGALNEICSNIDNKVKQLYNVTSEGECNSRKINLESVEKQIKELLQDRHQLKHLSRSQNININSVPEKWRSYVVDYIREKIRYLHELSLNGGTK